MKVRGLTITAENIQVFLEISLSNWGEYPASLSIESENILVYLCIVIENMSCAREGQLIFHAFGAEK